jgi:hypothetical protein
VRGEYGHLHPESGALHRALAPKQNGSFTEKPVTILVTFQSFIETIILNKTAYVILWKVTLLLLAVQTPYVDLLENGFTI